MPSLPWLQQAPAPPPEPAPVQAPQEAGYQPTYQPVYQPPQQPYPQPYQQPQGWRPPPEAPAAPAGRGGLVMGLVIGLVVGVVLAGTVGYFIGAGTNHGGSAQPSKSASASPSIPAFEANLLAMNQAKLGGDLAAIAKPWLPVVGGCVADTDVGGPKLPSDEKTHVFCRYGGVSVHFALFKSRTEREAAHAYRQQLNLDSDGLAPGLEQPSRKMGGVTHVSGDYVEYAFKGGDGRPVCGLWWDRDDSDTSALLLETLCEEGLGGKWEPLRDLWQRHS